MGNDNKDIAERFRKLRSNTGLSQKDFASTIGLSHTVIAEIERGSREPSRKVMVAIAETYGISLDWLLLGKGSMYAINQENQEVEILKKEISRLEEEIRKLQIENKEISRELIDRMRQLIDLQSQKLRTT